MFKKKLCLFLFSIILFMPLCVLAEDEVSTENENIVIPTVEEKNAEVEFAGCTIVSGNGKDIGSEVACGTEHFYVISNDGENVRMLAKYNLMVGYIFEKIEFGQTFDNYSDASSYLENNYREKYDRIWDYLYNENDMIYGAMVYSNIEFEKVMQDSLAIGAHGGEKGSPEFPEIGVYRYNYVEDAEAIASNATPYGGGGYIDFEFLRDSNDKEYFLEYQNTLLEIGVDVSNVSILSISDIDDIVYNLTGKRLPLEDWWYNWQEVYDGYHDEYYIIGDLKEYLPDGYEWLYSTTYWTRTFEPSDFTYHYFIDTLGNVCNGNACSVAIGAGLRPVVTTASSNLIYNIMTKTDGNGTVTASKVTSESGQEIEFTVTPREGYTLKRVIVRTASGEVLEFNEYKFRMPSENVEIYAEFERIGNPSTGFVFPFVVILVSVLCGIVVYLSQRESHSEEKS